MNTKKLILFSYLGFITILVLRYHFLAEGRYNMFLARGSLAHTLLFFGLLILPLLAIILVKKITIEKGMIIAGTFASYTMFLWWINVISVIRTYRYPGTELAQGVYQFSTVLPSFFYGEDYFSYSLLENILQIPLENIFALIWYTLVFSIMMLIYTGPMKKFVLLMRKKIFKQNS